jgi:nucleotide-binding universal stress UspA family protein
MPIDISAETRKKVRVVAEIAGFYGASVDVIALAETKTEAVTEKVNSYCTQVEDYLKEKKIPHKRKSITGSKADALIKYAEKEKANMIAIMTEQSENAMNLFLGPYAQQLVNHSHIPVLSVRSVY